MKKFLLCLFLKTFLSLILITNNSWAMPFFNKNKLPTTPYALEIDISRKGNKALKVIDYDKLKGSSSFSAVRNGIIQFAVAAAIDQIDGGDKMSSEEYAEVASQIIAQQAVTMGVGSYFGTEATQQLLPALAL